MPFSSNWKAFHGHPITSATYVSVYENKCVSTCLFNQTLIVLKRSTSNVQLVKQILTVARVALDEEGDSESHSLFYRKEEMVVTLSIRYALQKNTVTLNEALRGQHSKRRGYHGYPAINPLVTNILSHPYQLDESTLIFRVIGSDFSFLFHFSMKFL